MASADAVTDMHVRQLNQLEQDLVGLARAVPAGRYDFRPANGAFSDVRTYGEQVKHIATMIYVIAKGSIPSPRIAAAGTVSQCSRTFA